MTIFPCLIILIGYLGSFIHYQVAVNKKSYSDTEDIIDISKETICQKILIINLKQHY